MAGYIREITQHEGCGHGEGMLLGRATKCGEEATVIEIRRGDWRMANPRCGAHATGDPDRWIRASFTEATKVQIRMAAMEMLSNLAHRAGGGEDGPQTEQDLANWQAYSSAVKALVR